MLKEHGSAIHRCCLETSQQNGRAERKLGHIFNMMHALLLSTSLLEFFWGEVALTAVYTINLVPSTTLNYLIPCEILYHVSPDNTTLRTFGCVRFVLLHPHKCNKL